MDNTIGEVNPCHQIIINKVGKDDTIASQIEQWSIPSNVVNYIQYNWHPKICYNLDIKAVDSRSNKSI